MAGNKLRPPPTPLHHLRGQSGTFWVGIVAKVTNVCLFNQTIAKLVSTLMLGDSLYEDSKTSPPFPPQSFDSSLTLSDPS